MTSSSPRARYVFGESMLVFPSNVGGPLDYQNFKSRVFDKLIRKAFGRERRVTPRILRHTFAGLHLARRTNTMWVQNAGGWQNKTMLLDVYGHFTPT